MSSITLTPSTPKRLKKTGRIRINRKDTRHYNTGDLSHYFDLKVIDNDTIVIEFQYDANTTPKISGLMEMLI